MSTTNQSKAVLKNKRHPSGRQAAGEILILCTTTRMTSGNKERLSGLLAGKVDWEYLMSLVEFHNIAPLVYHNITENNLGDRVDKSCLERLQATYNDTLYRNVVFSSELARILSAFNRQDIPVIALKGLALAEMLYGNMVLRTMSDIDILVSADDLPRAGALLKEMGCEQSASPDRTSHPFHGAPYIKKGKAPFSIELHWNLEDERLISVPVARIWERSRTLKLQWGEPRVLSLEDTLIFSAIQLYKEFDRLKILGDIAVLIKKYEGDLDWRYIMDAARSWGTGTIIYYSLRRAKDLLEAPVPPGILEELKPEAWRRWAIGFFSSHEALLTPTNWLKIREETLIIVRSLMMSRCHQARLVLEKNRGKGKRAAWLRTTAWIIIMCIRSLWRNMAGLVSGRMWPGS